MIRGAVVDASAALAWVLPGEQREPMLHLRDRAVQEPAFALLVPPTFCPGGCRTMGRSAGEGPRKSPAAATGWRGSWARREGN